MGRITRRFVEIFQGFQQWEQSSQIGFVMAVLLGVSGLIVAGQADGTLRTQATVGAMGAVITAQIIFMWANRGMVTPYTRAQRAYLDESFHDAREILENLRQNDQADFKALTLLGNTYRQLGDLAQSEAILYEAVNIKPNHYFPLYGFGRTLLISGRYAKASDVFSRALEHGAPPATRFDLGEALFRDNKLSEARTTLKSAWDDVQEEPYRMLMIAWLLAQMGEEEEFLSAELIEQGLPYWETQVALFEQTPYGQLLVRDVHNLVSMHEEN